MPFNVQAIIGSTTQSLYDGSPFSIRSASGWGGAEIRRVTTQGPAQNGDSDLGYRLGVREMEMVIVFKAATDAALDTHRDTLTRLFKPLTATPIKLRVTRDDGEIRQIDCYTVKDIAITLAPEYRPGHYHEATIRLRAPDPAYYELAPGTATVTGTASLSANWWLAGGAIGTASVLMSGGTPAAGAAWSYAGTLGTATGWTMAFRSGRVFTQDHYAYGVDNNGNGVILGTDEVFFGVVPFGGNHSANGVAVGVDVMTGTANYFYKYDPPNVNPNYFYRTHETNRTYAEFLVNWANAASISGTARKWRVNSTLGTAWPETIHLYALYSPALSYSQISALNNYMEGAIGGTITQALAIPYEGDLPEYPTISIRGPITSPSIINTATGHELSFGTHSIGAGTTYTINTHPDYKTVLQGATNKRGELTKESDLGDWRLEAAPAATGGTNILSVTGTNAGTATQVQVVWYNRFSSY